MRAKLGRVNPVFQGQVFDVGEVTGVARDEGEAVGQRRATYHQVKIIDGPTCCP